MALAGANPVGYRPTVEASTDSADRASTTARTPPSGGAIVRTRRKDPRCRRPKQLRLRPSAAPPSEMRSLCPASARTTSSPPNPSPLRIRQRSHRPFRSPAAGARPSPAEAKASLHRRRRRPNPRDRRAQATRSRRSWRLFKRRDLPPQACRRGNQQCCRRPGRRLGFQLGCRHRYRQ